MAGQGGVLRIRLRRGKDDDILAWLATLPEQSASWHVRAAIREYMRKQAVASAESNASQDGNASQKKPNAPVYNPRLAQLLRDIHKHR